jgi:hypothetical protein
MDTLKTIKINDNDYNMSSPNSDEYKKLMIESFGDEYVDKKNIKLNVTVRFK